MTLPAPLAYPAVTVFDAGVPVRGLDEEVRLLDQKRASVAPIVQMCVLERQRGLEEDQQVTVLERGVILHRGVEGMRVLHQARGIAVGGVERVEVSAGQRAIDAHVGKTVEGIHVRVLRTVKKPLLVVEAKIYLIDVDAVGEIVHQRQRVVGGVVEILSAAVCGHGVCAIVYVIVAPAFLLAATVLDAELIAEIVVGAGYLPRETRERLPVPVAIPSVRAVDGAVDDGVEPFGRAVRIYGLERLLGQVLLLGVERGRDRRRAVLLLGIDALEVEPRHVTLLHQAQGVLGVQLGLAVAAVAERVLVRVAACKEVGARRGAAVVVDGLLERQVSAGAAVFVRAVIAIVDAPHAILLGARRHHLGGPCIVLAGLAVVVEVVDVAHQRDVGGGAEPRCEQTPGVSVLGAVSTLRVYYPPVVVLAFQLHVHRQVALLIAVVAPLLLGGLPLVDLDVLDGICGDVLEHQVVLAVKKLLAVQQQRFDKLAVHLYLSRLVQLHARQLGYQRVEHRAFGQLEGVGVEHHRVALVIELYLRGGHRHLVQLVGRTLHVDDRYPAVSLALAHILDPICHRLRLISLALDVKHIDRITQGDLKTECRNILWLSVDVCYPRTSHGVARHAGRVIAQHDGVAQVRLAQSLLDAPREV